MIHIHPALFNPWAVKRLERETGRRAVSRMTGTALLMTEAEFAALQRREAATASRRASINTLPPGPSAA